MNHLCYRGKPISSLTSLGKTLGIPCQRLSWLVQNAEKLYRPGPPTTKRDGSQRQVFNPAPNLKSIQRRINEFILEKVEYPDYLQGGIRDRKNPRDYVRNAGIHAGAKFVISEDISSYFPSIMERDVKEIWQYFFRFSPAVAKCLTALTTHQGSLPQGAPTSSYIANLIFWDIEPTLVERLKDRDLRYSRYIDDITISSRHAPTRDLKELSIKAVRAACKAKGQKLKKKKHRIESAANPMHVHRLVVNRKVSLCRKERSRIRSAVHQLMMIFQDERNSHDYEKKFNSIYGRVNNLARLHPRLGSKYKELLEKHKPS